MDKSRRDAVMKLLFGASWVGLRALVTGVPVGMLLAADAARPDKFARAAAARATSARTPQFVLFCTSNLGDPINCNAPGCYDDPGITHSQDPSMAATAVSLGGTSVKAAQVWSTLPSSMLNQASFFHHATYTVVHPDQTKVLHAQGATRSGELLPSLLSKNLAGPLSTLRYAPIDFNPFDHGAITCDGVLQPSLTPGSLAASLSLPGGGLGDANLVALRDQTVDGLNAWIKSQGQAFQGNVIDDFVISRGQVRTLQDNVVTQLQNIQGSGSLAMIQAAVLLFQMKVTPVVMVSLDFGGDNHTDTNFAGETSAHKAAIATLGQIPALVKTAGLDNQVSLCSLNVFGRELTSTNGRSHNDRHAVSLLIGANVKAGVVGGIGSATGANPRSARAIDSATGAANDSGDVGYSDSLASYSKTLLAAAGIDNATADNALRSGTIVQGALTA